LAVGAVLIAGGLFWLGAPQVARAAPMPAGAVRSPAFNGPFGVSSDGTHVWVADYDNSVTELDAATGALVQVITGSNYGFDSPVEVNSDGSHVWITNAGNNSVTELDAATGALVQVIGG
jgi:DNA-binding beta-propeller fold protein YncE